MDSIFKLPAYVGIIIEQDNKVLLVQRNHTNWMSGHWNFPGGLVEKDETLPEAAVREAQEETNIVIKSENCKLVHVLQVFKNEQNTQDIIGFYFKAEKWSGTPRNNEPDKSSHLEWFDIENLPDLITSHALLAIKGIKNKLSYSYHV